MFGGPECRNIYAASSLAPLKGTRTPGARRQNGPAKALGRTKEEHEADRKAVREFAAHFGEPAK